MPVTPSQIMKNDRDVGGIFVFEIAGIVGSPTVIKTLFEMVMSVAVLKEASSAGLSLMGSTCFSFLRISHSSFCVKLSVVYKLHLGLCT